ncbi:MAG: DUF1653 domain-containing protein [Agitococcus sp.]|nr:DUF1653 domain-containing protein [Agitococcus sp.]MDO9177076.1 DUF1653 domain-containing protein [Agitococcus sp.]
MLALPNFQVPTAIPSVPQAEPSASENLPALNQLVRHYKGGLYRTRGSCTIESTQKTGVLYQAIDPLARQDIWMRPITDFFSMIHEESRLQRFTAIPAASQEGLSHYLPGHIIALNMRDQVLAQQGGNNRFFHTEQHVFATFNLALSLGLELSPEQAVAVLFKDIINLPGVPEGTNEKLSALMLTSYAPYLPGLTIEKASKIIEDTAHRIASSEESKAVLDLDWGYLAADGLQFCATEELIWLENRHLLDWASPRKDFDSRRLKFLLSNADKGPIFQSTLFMQLEETARSNIEGLRLAWQQKYGKGKA